MNYFRITAYNRKEDYCIIMDSYGAFQELGQFSSYLVDKGFLIIAIGNEKFFNDGNIPKVEKTVYILLNNNCYCLYLNSQYNFANKIYKIKIK